MPTLEQIQTKMNTLQAQADALIARKAQAALDQIRELMIKHGFTTADIEAKAKARRERARATLAPVTAKGKTAPRYEDPKTGATWTGHGRAPAWIANVKDRTRFLIAGTPTVAGGTVAAGKSKAAAKSSAKSVAKGKLPAKYLNPKTGETWSGHARPPAWIKDVKDRSKFLIAGAADEQTAGAVTAKVTVKAKPAAKKAVAGTKAVTKKTTAKKVAARKAPAKKAVATKAAGRAVAAKKAAVRKQAGRNGRGKSMVKESGTTPSTTAEVAIGTSA
jgi:DNA-binding protein H-NS